MSTYDATYLAAQIHKSVDWVQRNAPKYPHHKAGQTTFWTDEDIAAILDAMRVVPTTETVAASDSWGDLVNLRPLPPGRRAG